MGNMGAMPNNAATANVFDLARPGQSGSRILTAFKLSREQDRRAGQVQREQAEAIAAFRRVSRPLTRRRGPEAVQGGGIEPAFQVVSGQRAFAAAAQDPINMSWTSHNSGINADLEQALTKLVARSRDWAVNSDLGARYLELVADNIVGADVPRLQVRAQLAATDELDEVANQAVESAWAKWCRRGCEVTGELSFGDVCRITVQTVARDGEYLARRIRDRRLPFGYQVQLLDIDRIDTRANVAAAAPGANCLRMGIELDAVGRKVAVMLLRHHPGDPGGAATGGVYSERVAADQMLHGFVLKRPEQVRGYPWTAAVLKRANTLHSFEGHALTAAKYGAAKMGFYTVDKDAIGTAPSWDDLKDATGELVQDMEQGMLEALPPGVGFESFDPKYPEANFSPFVTEYKRDIAVGLNVAHHNLTGNMNGVTYSSARIAELSERRSWRALQKWFINSFLRPVFEDWLRMALLTGSVRLPSGAVLPPDRFQKFADAASFQPAGWDWVDPEADIKSIATAATYDIRSMRSIVDEQGGDLEENLLDKARLKKRYETLGLTVPAWMGGGAAVMAPGAAPVVQQPAAAPAAQDNEQDHAEATA